MTTNKKVRSILPTPPLHWVGDGFPFANATWNDPVDGRHRPDIIN
jgi:hypothetical protein